MQLFRFSRSLFGISFLNFLFMRADIFVLGKLFSTAELGRYALAIYLVQTPATFLMNFLGQTLLPTFSGIQSDTARLNRILVRVISLTVLLGLPALAFLSAYSASLLTVVYGTTYSVAFAPLIVASFASFVNILNGQITAVFYGKGLPQIHRRCVTVMAIIVIALVYPLANQLGIVGGQVACLIAVIVGYLFQLVRAIKLTGLDPTPAVKAFLLSAATSLSMAGIPLVTWFFASTIRPSARVLFGLLSLVLAYVLNLAALIRSGHANTT